MVKWPWNWPSKTIDWHVDGYCLCSFTNVRLSSLKIKVITTYQRLFLGVTQMVSFVLLWKETGIPGENSPGADAGYRTRDALVKCQSVNLWACLLPCVLEHICLTYHESYFALLLVILLIAVLYVLPFFFVVVVFLKGNGHFSSVPPYWF